MEARCLRCRGPLNADALCPRCDEEEARVSEKLRRLRDEVARERGGTPPAEPASRLWKRKKRELATPSAEPAPGTTPDSALTPAPEGKTGSDGPPADRPLAGDGEASTAEAPRKRGVPPAETEPPRVHRGASASGLRARELDLTDARHGTDAIRELLEHRRGKLGKVIGIAGLPRHGKTELANRLRQRYAQRPGADLRYDKTERGEVNLYYLPGVREHHVLIDVAGEDFQALGDYDSELPLLVRSFLWPVLQELDGLLLLMALPIVWAGWNDPHQDRRQEPAERDEIAMREAQQRMVDAHRMLLKYAIVARDLERLRRRLPKLGLDPVEAPSRNQVDDAFKSARPLRVPVAVAFTKADLYAPAGQRAGLYTPDLPGRAGQPAPPLHPIRTDPWALAYLHFPDFFDFMTERVRHFTFDFVQALEDRSAEPDPQRADEEGAAVDRLVGAEALVEFVTQHPWGFPGLSSRWALALDRRVHRERWEADLIRRLHERPVGGAP